MVGTSNSMAFSTQHAGATADPLAERVLRQVHQRGAAQATGQRALRPDREHPPGAVNRPRVPLVFPVQSVKRLPGGALGCSGVIAQGQVQVGDQVRVTLSGEGAQVAAIETAQGAALTALAGEAVTLRLAGAIAVAPGDVISTGSAALETTDQFEATLVWLHRDAGLAGRSYDIELATQRARASLTSISYTLDAESLGRAPSSALQLNDIAVCKLATGAPLVFDTYHNSPSLGSFILLDRLTHATVAMGMIRHSLRRAGNIHRQALAITRAEREHLNGHKGKVVWFTGLSGSGKSTLASALEAELHAKGMRTYTLDGDNVRQGLNKDLGFSDGDRVENIRRVAEVAKLMADGGMIVMTAFISPFQRERDMARELIGEANFIEVYVSTPLAVCERRDVKGLYRQARLGKIPNMTGIGSPYEAPGASALQIDTGAASLCDAVRMLVDVVSRGAAHS